MRDLPPRAEPGLAWSAKPSAVPTRATPPSFARHGRQGRSGVACLAIHARRRYSALAIMREIEPEEKAAAKGRMKHGGRGKRGAKLAPVSKGKARDKAAKVTGRKRTTLAKAAAIVAAADPICRSLPRHPRRGGATAPWRASLTRGAPGGGRAGTGPSGGCVGYGADGRYDAALRYVKSWASSRHCEPFSRNKN
jgi:hypothetical protein